MPQTNKAAKDAYERKDKTLSMLAHKAENATEHHSSGSGQYIKSIIFGGLDGIITTFAVVAGVAGASLGAKTVIVLGVANLVADAVSMGFGEYLSSSAELEYAQTERKRECWELENYPEGEKEEMVEIYQKQGFTEEDARLVIDIVAKHKDFFVDHMMVHELGLMPPDEDDSPAKNAVVIFVSFLLFGFLPLLAYAFLPSDSDENTAFTIACVLTACTLFILGLVKGKLANRPYLRSGMFVLANGVIAAGSAYLIGWGLGEATGIEGIA